MSCEVILSGMSAGSNLGDGQRGLLHHPWTKAGQPFVVGAASGITAMLCTQPLDMIKVRLQLYGEGSKGGRPTPVTVFRDIVASGRVLDLYQGVSAALLRQVTYGMTRLGFFFTFEDMLKRRAEKRKVNYTFAQRALAGLAAGGLSAGISNPAEVALIRMQSDGLRPSSQRANYKSAFDALARIARTEGVFALWSGAQPTVVRAMATNFGQLAFFSETKHQLEQHSQMSSQMRSIAASVVAGFFAAFFSLPFDFMKTRLQRQTKLPDGTYPYRNVLDCFVKVAKAEGLLRFYRGFWTYFSRLAPHSYVTSH